MLNIPGAVLTQPTILPLTSRTQDGTLYQRPPEVEQQLQAVVQEPLAVWWSRLAQADATQPTTLRPETLVYLYRAAFLANNDAGCEAVGAALVAQAEVFLRRHVGRFVHHDADAEDCLQDCIAKLFAMLRDKPRRNDMAQVRFGVFLKALAREETQKYTRAAGQTQQFDSLDATENPDAQAELAAPQPLSPEDWLHWRKGLAQLDADDQKLLVLRYDFGLPFDGPPEAGLTLAHCLKVTGRTAQNRLRRAEQRLRDWHSRKL